MNNLTSNIILFCLLLLASCTDHRSYLLVECYDKSGQPVYINRLKEFSAAGIKPGEESEAHKCVITETNER